MAKMSPGMFGAKFCTTCGQRQRAANHTCHPSAVRKFERIAAWRQRSTDAASPPRKK